MPFNLHWFVSTFGKETRPGAATEHLHQVCAWIIIYRSWFKLIKNYFTIAQGYWISFCVLLPFFDLSFVCYLCAVVLCMYIMYHSCVCVCVCVCVCILRMNILLAKVRKEIIWTIFLRRRSICIAVCALLNHVWPIAFSACVRLVVRARRNAFAPREACDKCTAKKSNDRSRCDISWTDGTGTKSKIGSGCSVIWWTGERTWTPRMCYQRRFELQPGPNRKWFLCAPLQHRYNAHPLIFEYMHISHTYRQSSRQRKPFTVACPATLM